MTKQVITAAVAGSHMAAVPTYAPVRDFWLGRVDYIRSWQAMRRFSRLRHHTRSDQIWLLEHDPVYTAGLSCRNLPASINRIPVVSSDRGGRMSYHGPGQLMIYPLIDLSRAGLTITGYVRLLEQTMISALAEWGIAAYRWPGRPGVFVNGAKVAFIGVRVTGGCTYHGLAVNVSADISPFRHIDPCGFPDLSITSLQRLGLSVMPRQAGKVIVGHLNRLLASARADGLPERQAATGGRSYA